MKRLKLLFSVAALCIESIAFAQTKTLNNEQWKAVIHPDGTITSLLVNRHGTWDSIPMQTDTLKGVSWYVMQNKVAVPVHLEDKGNFCYEGLVDGIKYSLSYSAASNGALAIKALIRNGSAAVFQPEKAGLHMGISNYMAGYPQWNSIYFPTMLRAEKTHFTGYLETPTGKLLTVASPDPIASWSMNYNFGYGDAKIFFWGHRIYTFNLDLLNTQPLPARHPAINALKPGETRSWTILLKPTDQLSEIPATLAQLTGAPAFDLPATTNEAGKTFLIDIKGEVPRSVTVTAPNGKVSTLVAASSQQYLPVEGPGVYTLTATNRNGKRAEAMISVRNPWSWYLQHARTAALKYTQKASWNCENWYGFYSAYLAQCYFPDNNTLTQTNKRFDSIMPLMYAATWEPTKMQNRIQNHTTTIGILVDKYRATGNIRDLEAAATLADWILKNAQSEDGAYRRGHTHYTSVIYVAKSIMELMAEEKKLSASNWKERYNRHYASVKRAIDQLTGGVTGLDTEGELTLEDGMISCTALQIGAFALLQEDRVAKARYTRSMLEYLDMHECLTQLVKADSRQRGGTMRFWEAQYDVLLANNMFNSPHGWTAWRIYATYYAYLLTGEEKWLVQTMNALGSCAQLMDFKTGDLRWAFVTDPYVNTLQVTGNFPGTSPDNYNNNQYKTEEGTYKPVVVGEQYVPMIANWFYANSSDNDVHEIFKCMEEVALTSAYVLERKDRSLLAYNCTAEWKNGILVIHTAETLVNKVHVNLPLPREVNISWKNKTARKYAANSGSSWLQ
ncbi:hypothetical protein CLV59_101737 [Chitinophaga dinghuensis]|uniref:Alpha-L-rhamnosidase six-hairpin glycosidase domain-containing protein n=1 Tax=Chitinophaga dinghuensis TaxID=1539050 RepID=A0A327WDH9_9BACT|nr:hypothetical protein [Chitinophaga dinghuensis]RAJ87972.1 hypothetical protein CLV59_101737 [Chitinophaga dinghuensis]